MMTESSTKKKRPLFKRFRESLGYYFGGLYNRLGEHHVFMQAGGLAFALITCIIPLVLIIFSIVGLLLEEPSIAEHIEFFIDKAVPYQEYSSFVKEIVFDRLDEFTLRRNIAGILGVLGLMFASSGLFSAMRTILNTVFQVQSDEPILMGKLRDFGFVLSMLFVFLAALTVLQLWQIVEGFADKAEILEPLRIGLFEEVALEVVSMLILLVAFYVVYFFVPYKRPNKRVVLVSAFWAALLWKLAEQAFGLYITEAATLTRIYGAYALLIVVVFWLYYSSIVFIISAEIGQLYREKRRKRMLLSKNGSNFFSD